MPAADHSCVRSGSNDKSEYRPRNPEDSLLYRTIAANLETFLARQQERGREVPHFVEHEMRAYLSCGVLACGFLRLKCESCGKDRLLRFLAKSDPSVRPVADGAWPIPQPTWWPACFPMFRHASGFSRCRSPYATVWPTTRRW